LFAAKGRKRRKDFDFSLQPSAFSLRFAALAIPAFLPNSHLPSADGVGAIRENSCNSCLKLFLIKFDDRRIQPTSWKIAV
jgi:hypothetical protein